MRNRILQLVAAACAGVALSVVAAPAQASTWLINYVSHDGAPLAASLLLDVSDTLNAHNGYNVLGVISGDVDGDDVSGGLTANPTPGVASYSADGWFIFDNVVWNAGARLSNPGLLFASATTEYNLFSDNPDTYELYSAHPGQGYAAHSVGTLSAQQVAQFANRTGAVPEPTTWALMIGGFAILGAALRRRRAQPSFIG